MYTNCLQNVQKIYKSSYKHSIIHFYYLSFVKVVHLHILFIVLFLSFCYVVSFSVCHSRGITSFGLSLSLFLYQSGIYVYCLPSVPQFTSILIHRIFLSLPFCAVSLWSLCSRLSLARYCLHLPVCPILIIH